MCLCILWFSYLIASMGLQMLWSFGLACLDIYALRRKRDLQNPVLVSLFVVGDWVRNLFLISFVSKCKDFSHKSDSCILPHICKFLLLSFFKYLLLSFFKYLLIIVLSLYLVVFVLFLIADSNLPSITSSCLG